MENRDAYIKQKLDDLDRQAAELYELEQLDSDSDEEAVKETPKSAGSAASGSLSPDSDEWQL